MKRVLSVLILVAAMLVAVCPASAAPKRLGKWEIIQQVPNSEFDYYELKTGQPNPGKAATTDDASLQWATPPPGTINFYDTVSVPYIYSQKDSAWASDIMQTEELTISSAGCALTSATMVFRKWGTSSDPHYFNIGMGDYACPFYWYEAPGLVGEECIRGDSASPYVRLGQNYSDPLPQSDWYNMAWALYRGYLPMLEVTRPNETYHWVVVKKVWGDYRLASSYRIVDPNGGLERPLTYYTVGQNCRLTSLVIYEPT